MCSGACHHPRSLAEGCLSGGWVRGFLQPRIVLLLLDKPTHGYELLERLAQQHTHLPGADPGLLYRTLRQLEGAGLLRSSWETAGQGPARRLYEVTPAGVAFLHTWAARAVHIRRCLGQFLEQYQAALGDQALPAADLPSLACPASAGEAPDSPTTPEE